MPAWALKIGATFATLIALVGSYDYTTHHLYNAAAPLHPPVDGVTGQVVEVTPRPTGAPAPTATPLPSLLAAKRGQVRPSSSPGPLITLQPGVRATALPSITLTHVS